MNKKNHFIKIFFTIFTLIVFLFVLSVINYISCLKSSQKLSFYSNNNHEIMRIKIYGSSTSKEGNTISGTFSIINMNGNEIAVIERSWNGSYLGVEFNKIKLNGHKFVFPIKVYGKENIIETKKDLKKYCSVARVRCSARRRPCRGRASPAWRMQWCWSTGRDDGWRWEACC